MIPQVSYKKDGFNYLPPGTIKEHDAGTWAIYYNALYNISVIVVDFPDMWRNRVILGKVQTSYAQSVVKTCCNGMRAG